ncbi:SDR family NAD(P)-dependent oxidoreductase [Devosia sp.]|uniref:SDR family NAD(P)-dependent oxidoreductase n=1 Tax=Devosia sp. TaxID=1871048 RepID=UPI002F240BD4
MKLQGRVAMITGGSSGIGRATAERFAREGARVAVLASNDRAKAEAVARAIVAAGGHAEAFAADVRDVAALAAVTAEVTRSLGPIDILVNAAGVYYPTPIGQTTEEDFDRMVDINLKGMFFAINAVAPGMKERRRGRIINVASVAAFRGSARFPLYSATKAAVVMLTKALAGDLAPYDVHINAIAPGNTATPLNENDRLGPDAAATQAAKAAATPSTRIYSPPEEMAAAALFLAADEVRAMHGATILLDEGLSACV